MITISNTIGLLIQGPIMSIGQGAGDIREYSDENLKLFITIVKALLCII